MSKDILNRIGKEGDLVIKSIPTPSGTTMVLGVIKGKSIYYNKKFKYNISHCKQENYYIIENPNKKELEIKEQILK